MIAAPLNIFAALTALAIAPGALVLIAQRIGGRL